jgi:hypothetical protein
MVMRTTASPAATWFDPAATTAQNQVQVSARTVDPTITTARADEESTSTDQNYRKRKTPMKPIMTIRPSTNSRWNGEATALARSTLTA